MVGSLRSETMDNTAQLGAPSPSFRGVVGELVALVAAENLSIGDQFRAWKRNGIRTGIVGGV